MFDKLKKKIERECFSLRKVGLFGELKRRLTLALLVLEITIEEHNSRILNTSSHARMHNVLVEHDASQHLGLLDRTARNLLDTRIPLDVDLTSTVLLDRHGLHGVERNLARQIGPFAHELRANTTLDDLDDLLALGHVDRRGHFLLEQSTRLLERLSVRADYHGRMHLLLQELLGHGEHLAREHDHARRAVADLFVLRAANLDH